MHPQPPLRPTPRRDVRRSPGFDRGYNYTELIAYQGGMTPLLFTAREGHTAAATELLEAGADVNQPRDGDQTTPLLMATINGHFDLAKLFLDRGADPRLAGENGATPLYAVLNCVYAQKSNYPAAARASRSRS